METQDFLFLRKYYSPSELKLVLSTVSLMASEPQSTETGMEQVTSKIFIQTPMSAIQV